MFNLAVIGLYVVSGLAGDAMPAMPIPTETSVNQIQLEARKQDESKEITTEAYVKNYFSDTPILAEVARCESQFRQTDKSGRVIRGKANRYDVGVMQINELYHLDKSKNLGYDIYTTEGNLAYARYLYEKEGARPWMASSGCWAKFREIALSNGSNFDHTL